MKKILDFLFSVIFGILLFGFYLTCKFILLYDHYVMGLFCLVMIAILLIIDVYIMEEF